MTKPGSVQVEWARRLLAHERAASGAEARGTTAAGRVYEKIHLHMGPLFGEASVHLLFLRSATLVQGEFAGLAGVSLLESSTRLRERLQAQAPAVAAESAKALFATFLTLSNAFVGERLTTQVLRNAWPTIKKIDLGERSK